MKIKIFLTLFILLWSRHVFTVDFITAGAQGGSLTPYLTILSFGPTITILDTLRIHAHGGVLRALYSIETTGDHFAYGVGGILKIPTFTFSPTIGAYYSWDQRKKGVFVKKFLSPFIGAELKLSNEVYIGIMFYNPYRRRDGKWRAKRFVETKEVNGVEIERKETFAIIPSAYIGVDF